MRWQTNGETPHRYPYFKEDTMDKIDTATLTRIIDRLREECDIRDPQRKNGYLTALLDVQEEIWKLEEQERCLPF